MLDNIQFEKDNRAGYFNEGGWQEVSAVINADGDYEIAPGGYIRKVLQEEVQGRGKYWRLVNRFKGHDLDAKNSYKSRPMLYIRELYFEDELGVDNIETRGFGFSTNLKVGDGWYRDEKIYEAVDKLVYSVEIVVENTSKETITLKTLQLYRSEDISREQITNIVADIQKDGQSTNFKVYLNNNRSMNGLAVRMGNTDFYKGYKIDIKDGRIVGIGTNTGEYIDCKEIYEDMDLENIQDKEEELLEVTPEVYSMGYKALEGTKGKSNREVENKTLKGYIESMTQEIEMRGSAADKAWLRDFMLGVIIGGAQSGSYKLTEREETKEI